MAFFKNIPETLRGIFDDGLDEVLIFAVVFIFILFSGRETDNSSEYGDTGGILPILIIAVFLLLFAGFGRRGENAA